MDNLDKKIQDLASTDWQTFLSLVGPDVLFEIKVRILHQDGKSYQQIAVKLEEPMHRVRYALTKNKSDKNCQT